MSRESAAPAPGDTGAEQATGESNAATITTTQAVDILQYAGVPEEVVKALQAEGTEAEPRKEDAVKDEQQEPKAEQAQPELPEQPHEEIKEPESDASTEEEEAVEPDEGPAEDETPEPEEPQGEKPDWYEKRVSKWGRQKQRLQDEIDDLREQIAGKAKETEDRGPRAEGRPRDTLSQVTNFEELNKVVEAQRAVRDWCMDNPDGMVIAEGTPNEKVISPEEVRKTLIGATRIIEDAPKRGIELQQEAKDQQTRAQWHQIANLEWPELFDKTSEIYQTSQQFLKQYPEIDRNPNRDFLLGLMVEGWKPFQARMIERQKANGQQAGSNGAAASDRGYKESLPEALKRKIPPIPKTQAPNPPRGSRRNSPQDEAAAAVQRLAREGGSPEAAQAAIAAIERQNAMSGDTKRMPAPI